MRPPVSTLSRFGQAVPPATRTVGVPVPTALPAAITTTLHRPALRWNPA